MSTRRIFAEFWICLSQMIETINGVRFYNVLLVHVSNDLGAFDIFLHVHAQMAVALCFRICAFVDLVCG
jgi:hypothetical protein